MQLPATCRITGACPRDPTERGLLCRPLAPGFSRSPTRELCRDGFEDCAIWGKVRLEIVRKAKGQQGFAVLPWRWIVERTFAWCGRYRRLKSDYERLPETTEAIIHIAMIRLMLRRLSVFQYDDTFQTRSEHLGRLRRLILER